jgi:formamidopyrimidine-DNA glycosylase
MPELPEVETTRRSLEGGLVGRRVREVRVREPRLRWPVPEGLATGLQGALIRNLGRRAKYLMIETDRGTAMVHLGMSGRLRIVEPGTSVLKHDHVDVVLDDGRVLRYHDPRRFGSIHWLAPGEAEHPLLRDLAPEPLSSLFDGSYLHTVTRRRAAAIKQIIMNGNLVTGVGNIYASEALHAAGIHPKTSSRRLSRARCDRLADAIRTTLGRAIAAGGSTLRDYVDGAGRAGDFQNQSAVYGRAGEACPRCGNTIRLIRQGQRSTFYCPGCQH